ncbi:hypothetical protein [Spongiactinospora sp. TRM90649]|uniref:hypothetical protein n=1 Tax=Spongiactinospora sp. TRM90649 TaxID=3031114 RepID=UPI0023F87DC0|nr:hypothetical protein [Spongiactinospora sp. TRM90649]MDF5753949.1 hypothetical protein [Spongiactinospora sp. TRM90649]
MTAGAREAPGRLRRLAPAAGLFVLAPLTGEFLLGNVPITGLLWLPLLAPLYGGGALLIREVARRMGAGWPSIACLAVAYALLEEGPVDQLLWNDSYAGHDYLHGPSFVPVLGTSVELVQTVIALHAVWSICVPIAIVESFVPERRETPWLGGVGLGVVAAVFVAGAAFVFTGNYAEEQFLAPAAQVGGALAVIAGLVALAVVLRGRRAGRDVGERSGSAPPPIAVGALGLVATSAYWGPLVLFDPPWYEWIGVGVWFVVAGGGLTLVWRWSGRPGWGARHRLALAGGALLTYVWSAFPLAPEIGGVSPAVDLAGNAMFGGLAVLILALAARRVRRSSEDGRAE